MNLILCVTIITVPSKETIYAKHYFSLLNLEKQVFCTRAEYGAAAKLKGLAIAKAIITSVMVNEGEKDSLESDESASLKT
jgi:hypothetical protein